MTDPVQRIFSEPPVYADSSFHVVKDKDPVCPAHYLILPRQRCASLADLPSRERIGLNRVLSAQFQNFLFMERGNVAFCTSFNADFHAHAHLVNKAHFRDGIVGTLLGVRDYRESDSLQVALSATAPRTEYLVAGLIDGLFAVVTPFIAREKRYIRNILLENSIR